MHEPLTLERSRKLSLDFAAYSNLSYANGAAWLHMIPAGEHTRDLSSGSQVALTTWSSTWFFIPFVAWLL